MHDGQPTWMTEGRALEVEVSARDLEPLQGTIYSKELTVTERRKRAMKGLVLCWLLAFLSLPIVFLHFILVPAFLLAGGVLFAIKMREGVLVLGGVIPCPSCGESCDVAPQAQQWPMGLNCGACGKGLDFSPALSTPGGCSISDTRLGSGNFLGRT